MVTTEYDVLDRVRSSWSVNQLEAIKRGELDAGLCYGFEPVPPECRQRLLQTDHVLLAVPRSWGWLGPMRCAELQGKEFVGLKKRLAPHYVKTLRYECERQGLAPRVVQLVEDENTLLCLVAAGVGLGLVNSAQRARSPGNVDFLEIEDFELPLPLLLLWRSDNSNPTLAHFRGLF